MSRLNKILLLFIGLALVFSAFPPLQALAQANDGDCAEYYRVRRGDTLYRIGLRFGVSWPEIAEANNIRNPNRIYAGQVLCIPGDVDEPEDRPARVPTFVITGVVRDETVTIRTSDFPARTRFVVRMGRYGTLGIRGIAVAEIDTGAGGSFAATFNIPEELQGRNRIAIRLESKSGYFSYNWFYNRTVR